VKTLWPRLGTLLLCIAILLGAWLGYLRFMPSKAGHIVEAPKALQDAEAGPDFTLMLSDLKQMSARVHNVGSPGIQMVQDYIRDRAAELGYETREDRYSLSMEDVLDLRRAWGRGMDATPASIREDSGIGDAPAMDLVNLYVHLDAPDTEETIFLVAHTDSVKEGPGAFDDTVSVAAMLEGLRLLKGQTLRRDVVFLFTDGEEQGLLGAFLFVEEHPELVDKARLVLNLEARGNSGALLMFETSDKNLAMVRHLNRALQRPVSTSIATAVYRSMQNDTDLTAFFRKGRAGMNFACIDNPVVYHTAQDNYETFSRDTARQYLDDVTALARYFATAPDLELDSGEDGVFFPLPFAKLAVVPEGIAKAVSWGIALLTLVFLFVSIRKKRARLSYVMASFAGILFDLALATALVYGLQEGIHALFFGRGGSMWGSRWSTPVFLAMALVFCFGGFFLARVARKGRTPFEKALGALLLPAIICLALPFVFPGGIYLGGVVGAGGLVYLAAASWSGRRLLVPLMLLGALMTAVIAPIGYLLYTALGFYASHLAIGLIMLPVLTLGALDCYGAKLREQAEA